MASLISGGERGSRRGLALDAVYAACYSRRREATLPCRMQVAGIPDRGRVERAGICALTANQLPS